MIELRLSPVGTSLARQLLAGAALLLPAHPSAFAMQRALVDRHTVSCNQRQYQYLLSKPHSHEPMPALMLLHGAGGRNSEMVELWASLAAREHLVLIAPQLPREIAFEREAPFVFRCVLADAERSAAIDTERVYLFGYSMGGYLAFDGAMFDSDIFAGAGVYASVIDPGYDSIVEHAARKIPIAIFIGDHDQFNSIDRARHTRALLEKNGFPVHYVEFAGQDHSYTPVRDSVNDETWHFLSKYRLSP